MIFSYSLMLALFELLLFISISMRTGGRLFIAELIAIIVLLAFITAAMVFYRNRKTSRFMLQMFALTATANALLLYLALPLSIGILLSAAVGITLFIAASIKKGKAKPEPKKESRRKKAEIDKQLGPIEKELPKVIVEEAPRRKARRARRKRK